MLYKIGMVPFSRCWYQNNEGIQSVIFCTKIPLFSPPQKKEEKQGEKVTFCDSLK